MVAAHAALLSRHSSNPLEVPTSDVQNRRYLKQYRRAQETRDHLSSEDPIAGFRVPEIDEYHHHIARLYNKTPPPAGVIQPKVNEVIPDEVYSDDELEITGNVEEDCTMIDAVEEGEQGGGADDDEEISILLKPREEQEEIEDEITDLEDAVPELMKDYKIVDRLGTGTFSSVYKAVDLGYHTKWHNDTWRGRHPPSSSAHYQSSPKPVGTKAMVAIKRIYVTSNPERIRNEISIMEDCRGCRHVSQLITAFRHEDQVVAIMPYHRNEDFRDIYRVLPMTGIKAYFQCLLRALRDIHARKIIHRDVKPANFLFDIRTGSGTLCDFGLASRIEPHSSGYCLHTAPTAEFPHGRLKSKEAIDVEQIKAMQREARQKSSWPSDRVGYLEKDFRPHSKANRAGTRGFRAPEVLLKCNEQTGAIDIWATGMILLFFLTGKFPLFQSNDDIEALMEIAAIIGRRRMEKAATLHSRTFATNVPTVTPEGMTWREFVQRQNPDLFAPPPPSSSPPELSSSASDPTTQAFSTPTKASSTQDVDLALDLLDHLLQPESTKRITARSALYHPFLLEESAEDDEFFPHPLGKGVCGLFHFKDSVTEEHCITGIGIDGSEVKRLSAGEGIAIGRKPCEYHEQFIEDGVGQHENEVEE